MKTLSNESKLLLSLLVAPVLVMGCGDAVTAVSQSNEVIHTSPDLNSADLTALKPVGELVSTDESEAAEVTGDSELPDDIDLATYRVLKAASDGW